MPTHGELSRTEFYLGGILLILSVGAIYVAKAILLPVLIAFMLTLTLSPVVRFLARHGVPEVVSAFVAVVCVVGVVATAAYSLSGPLSGWVEGAPNLRYQIEQKFERLRRPLEAVVGASQQVERMARTEDPSVQTVVVRDKGIVGLVADNALAALTTAGITVVLSFFLLASGRMFYEKLVRILPTLAEKKRAIRIVHAVEEEVSRYLLTITAINAALGLVIGTAMWWLEMPNPALWGVMAMLFNFVPYVGAVVGVAVVSVVALVSLDSLGSPLIVGATYFVCTVIEGQFVTPAIVGRRLEMNTVAVFLAVAFWGWLWGVPGALMAVPLLVGLRVFCEHFEGLGKLGEFLAGPVPAADDDEPPA
ncbi:MAG: AI-2E family transporter [Lautropia sp.]